MGGCERGLARQVLTHHLRGHNAVGLPSSISQRPLPLRLGKSGLHALQHSSHHRRTKGHRGSDGFGGAVPGDSRALWLRLVPRQSRHWSAPAPAPDARAAMDRCVLLHVWLRLPEANTVVAFTPFRGSLQAQAHLLQVIPLPRESSRRSASQICSTRGRSCQGRGAQAER